MPTYQFEAMDASGQEIRDVLEATSEEEAQATIRQMGYFVTKISVKKGRADAAAKPGATVAKKKNTLHGFIRADRVRGCREPDGSHCQDKAIEGDLHLFTSNARCSSGAQ